MKNKFNLFNISVFSIFAILLTRQLHYFNVIVRFTSGMNATVGFLFLGVTIVFALLATTIVYYLPAVFIIEITHKFNYNVILPEIGYTVISTNVKSIFVPSITNQKLQVIRC